MRRVLDRAMPEENPAGVVYGIITVGALLAAESGLHETYLAATGSAVVALVLYWLAHAYANLLGHRLATGERLSPRGLLRELLHDWAIVRGAAVPLLALLAAWVLGATQETAVTVAVWVSAASIVAFELLAGIRAKSSPGELLLEGCVGATMGLAIVAMRAILHP